MATKKFIVECACDADGDHTAPLAECTQSKQVEFEEMNPLLHFMAECTYIYNKEVLLGSVGKPSKRVFQKQSSEIFKKQF